MQNLIGLSGAIVVREVVELVKPLWDDTKLNGIYDVVAAVVVGILLNAALAVSLGNSLPVAVGVGVVTGFVASVWNKIVDVTDGIKG